MANPLGIGGGSRKGKPNKASSARVERAVREGRRLPHESLFLIGENSLAMAALYQPERTQEDGTKVANPEHNEEQYAKWMAAACDAFAKAAPYYAARLHAVAVQNVPSGEQGPRADPRQVMWEIYKGMRDRGELGLKTIEPPKPEAPATATESHTPVIEPDDADGVAV
jgi:hypothetical protein